MAPKVDKRYKDWSVIESAAWRLSGYEWSMDYERISNAAKDLYFKDKGTPE